MSLLEDIQKPSGYSPEQLGLGVPAPAVCLDQVISRGPVKTQPSFGFMSPKSLGLTTLQKRYYINASHYIYIQMDMQFTVYLNVKITFYYVI